MKKFVALLCSAVMMLGLSSSAMADGSITVPVTQIEAFTQDGEALTATSIKDLDADTINWLSSNPAVKSIMNLYLNGKADEAYRRIKLLAGDEVTTTSDTPVNLDDYEPVDTLTLIDTEVASESTELEVVEIATDFEMSQDKTVEDYLVCVIDPVQDEDVIDVVSFVEPVLNDENEFSYDLTFRPAIVQILEKL